MQFGQKWSKPMTEVEARGAVDANHDRLAPLEEKIGYRFHDRELLHGATIHRSFANETEDDVADNEVLEFLGDAVLGLVVSDLLYRRNPGMSEGEMSKLKAFLVSSESLAPCRRLAPAAHPEA